MSNEKGTPRGNPWQDQAGDDASADSPRLGVGRQSAWCVGSGIPVSNLDQGAGQVEAQGRERTVRWDNGGVTIADSDVKKEHNQEYKGGMGLTERQSGMGITDRIREVGGGARGATGERRASETAELPLTLNLSAAAGPGGRSMGHGAGEREAKQTCRSEESKRVFSGKGEIPAGAEQSRNVNNAKPLEPVMWGFPRTLSQGMLPDPVAAGRSHPLSIPVDLELCLSPSVHGRGGVHQEEGASQHGGTELVHQPNTSHGRVTQFSASMVMRMKKEESVYSRTTGQKHIAQQPLGSGLEAYRATGLEQEQRTSGAVLEHNARHFLVGMGDACEVKGEADGRHVRSGVGPESKALEQKEHEAGGEPQSEESKFLHDFLGLQSARPAARTAPARTHIDGTTPLAQHESVSSCGEGKLHRQTYSSVPGEISGFTIQTAGQIGAHTFRSVDQTSGDRTRAAGELEGRSEEGALQAEIEKRRIPLDRWRSETGGNLNLGPDAPGEHDADGGRSSHSGVALSGVGHPAGEALEQEVLEDCDEGQLALTRKGDLHLDSQGDMLQDPGGRQSAFANGTVRSNDQQPLVAPIPAGGGLELNTLGRRNEDLLGDLSQPNQVELDISISPGGQQSTLGVPQPDPDQLEETVPRIDSSVSGDAIRGNGSPLTNPASEANQGGNTTPRAATRRGQNRNQADAFTHRIDASGYTWKKYSHKTLRGTQCERVYYSCVEKDTSGCKARKIIDRPKVRQWRGDSVSDVITLDGEHNHAPQQPQ